MMAELRWILIVAGALILLAVYLWGRRLSPRAEEKETILRSRAEPLISTPTQESLASDPYANEPYAYDAELRTDARLSATDAAQPASEPMLDNEDEPIVADHREPIVADASFIIDEDDEPTISSAPESTLAEPSQDHSTIEPSEREVQPAAASAAPVNAPPARRPRASTPRKILVLRLAAGPARIPGEKLRAAFEAQGLTFGKYDIFHYIHSDGQVLFSVASMVEPGSFDLERMTETPFPGVTLFAQLPGSVGGLEVLEELLRNAKLLQSAVGGTLQDDRGALLNSPRIQRLRQEVIDFEHLSGAQQDEVADSQLNA